jgi:hypothetical protein
MLKQQRLVLRQRQLHQLLQLLQHHLHHVQQRLHHLFVELQ